MRKLQHYESKNSFLANQLCLFVCLAVFICCFLARQVLENKLKTTTAAAAAAEAAVCLFKWQIICEKFKLLSQLTLLIARRTLFHLVECLASSSFSLLLHEYHDIRRNRKQRVCVLFQAKYTHNSLLPRHNVLPKHTHKTREATTNFNSDKMRANSLLAGVCFAPLAAPRVAIRKAIASSFADCRRSS